MGLRANPTFESLALEGRTYDFDGLDIPGRGARNYAQGFFSPLDPSGELHPTDEGHDAKVEKALAATQAMKEQFDAVLEHKRRENARLFQDAPRAQTEPEMAASAPLGPGREEANQHWEGFMSKRSQQFKKGPDLNDRQQRNRERELARQKVERGKALEHKRVHDEPEEYDIATPRQADNQDPPAPRVELEAKCNKRQQSSNRLIRAGRQASAAAASRSANHERRASKEEHMAGKRASAEQIARKRNMPAEHFTRMRKRRTEAEPPARRVRFDVGPIGTTPR